MPLKPIIWRDGLTVPTDPDANEIYQWAWADWLDGETLADVDVLPSADITAVEYYRGADYVDVRVSAAALGAVHSVTVRATSSGSGRVQDRTVQFDCKER